MSCIVMLALSSSQGWDDTYTRNDKKKLHFACWFLSATAAAGGGGGKTLLRYERAFLIDCGRRVNASMLQANWAKLCSQFKDVCLSPQVHACICSAHVLGTGIKHSVCLLCTLSWYVNVKFFPSHKAHRVALICIFSALSQTPVYTVRPRIRGLVRHVVCLLCLTSLRLPTKDGQAELTWMAVYIPRWFACVRDSQPSAARCNSMSDISDSPCVDKILFMQVSCKVKHFQFRFRLLCM